MILVVLWFLVILVASLQGDVDKLASIYAKALVDLAQSKNALDAVHADVDSLQV
jgi:hypothetical protein